MESIVITKNYIDLSPQVHPCMQCLAGICHSSHHTPTTCRGVCTPIISYIIYQEIPKFTGYYISLSVCHYSRLQRDQPFHNSNGLLTCRWWQSGSEPECHQAICAGRHLEMAWVCLWHLTGRSRPCPRPGAGHSSTSAMTTMWSKNHSQPPFHTIIAWEWQKLKGRPGPSLDYEDQSVE